MSGGLQKEIQYLKGVGPERAKAFKKLGISNLSDMIFYAPRAWADRSIIKPISKVIPGERESVRGIVYAVGTKKIRPRLAITSVVIRDQSGFITGVWYNQPYMEKRFSQGDEVIFFGRVETYRGQLQINSPEYDFEEKGSEALDVKRIVPVYPLTEALTQKVFRKIMKSAIDEALPLLNEYLPDFILNKIRLMNIKDAVYNLHFPDDGEKLKAARYRLAFDEFYALQLALQLRRKNNMKNPGIIFNINGEKKNALRSALPFKLTGAQRRVVEEIKNDFISGRPMNRLVQGDVGSGKTIVALIACVIAADSGHQAAVMAPTEILARQHMAVMGPLCEKIGIKTALLLGGMKKKEKEEAYKSIESGEAGLVIGTHALITPELKFKSLALCIIDEQHRFGVMQRAKLLDKSQEGIYPHCLIMTATPIPRTLSLAVYGDTDISIIDELPPGRKPVKTIVFPENKKEAIFEFIQKRLDEGGRVYAVYPLVEESEKLSLKSAVEMHSLWSARFPKANVGLIHGRMNAEEKDAVMADFKSGKSSVLVATTVIEVGVDVPDATVILIEHAERFGLSQLHQLRGRVGRGSSDSWCVLIADPSTEGAFARMNIMASTNDGFKIAEEDLKLRGPGEFMGTKQSGLPEFRIADIIKDKQIMETAKKAAEITVFECDNNHFDAEALKDIIKTKLGKNLDLINIG